MDDAERRETQRSAHLPCPDRAGSLQGQNCREVKEEQKRAETALYAWNKVDGEKNRPSRTESKHGKGTTQETTHPEGVLLLRFSLDLFLSRHKFGVFSFNSGSADE